MAKLKHLLYVANVAGMPQNGLAVAANASNGARLLNMVARVLRVPLLR